MKFYVVSSFGNKNEVCKAVAMLEAKGWQCTYSWADSPASTWENSPESACKEIQGATHADLLIVLAPGGKGTHVEIGAALAAGKPVHIWAARLYVLAEGGNCVFYNHPLVEITAGCSMYDAGMQW